MAKAMISTKRLAITKANAQIVAIVGVAAFLTVFCLVASKAVWSQTRYQAKVTSASEKAHKQLKANIKAFGALSTSYNTFNDTPLNIIGGSSTGTGGNDGNNAKIIVDALPSTYDFPALTSSLEKILTAGNYHVDSITGTDDQLNQQGNISSPSPQPVPMPFTFSIANTNYAAIQQLINTLQLSIRPLQIDSLDLTGGNANMTLAVDGHTYYQPGKAVNITKQVVK